MSIGLAAILNDEVDQHSLYHIPAKQYSPEDIAELRDMIGVDRRHFALLLGVETEMVCDYETGDKIPSRMARRFMDEMAVDPSRWRRRLVEAVVYL